MNNLRKEFLSAITMSLKIAGNAFIQSTLDEYTKDIKPTDYKSFMTALFGTNHQYLNGLDRVAKVAEQFKPIDKIHEVENKANELINIVRAMNSSIYSTHIKTGKSFEGLLNQAIFPSISKETINILDSVKPYCNHKTLIAKINHYQTAKDALNAFMIAIEYVDKSLMAIESGAVRKMIKG